jgi:hypothetical protein
MENTMNDQAKLILALMQIENVRNLTQNNQYTGFFVSHLLPIKYELERQLTNLSRSDKI